MKFDIARQPLVPAFLTLAALAVVAMWNAGGTAADTAALAGHASETVGTGRNAAGALAVSSPGELLAQFQEAHPVWARWIAGLLMLFTGMSVGRLTVRYNLYSVGTCLAIPLYGAIACGLAVGGDYLTAFAASALLALAIVFVKMAVVIIPQSETRIIERLGKYYATLKPGVNIIIPFIDRAKVVVTQQRGHYFYSSAIDLREQVYDFDKQNVITKDNIQMQINALLYFQIVDPFKTVYEINNLPNAIEKLTQTTLRNIIGEMELDQTLTSRDTINTKLRGVLDDATNKWGIKVNRVELQDITPPSSVLQAREKQMQAERNKRAAILTSEGDKQSQILQSEGDKAATINRAEADKQQAILRAEGEATARIRKAEAEAIAIAKITEAVGKSTNPANYLLAQKYIQMLNEVAQGDKTKTVFLPYEATNLMGSIGGIKELFKGE